MDWKDRNHFFSMAARTMRRVLVDYARRRSARKRRLGATTPRDVDPPVVPPGDVETLIELDDALSALEQAHPRPGAVIEMYYFGGLTQQEIGESLSLSQPTVSADLRFGRAFMARAIAPESARLLRGREARGDAG